MNERSLYSLAVSDTIPLVSDKETAIDARASMKRVSTPTLGQ